jgi:hypothetical protein
LKLRAPRALQQNRTLCAGNTRIGRKGDGAGHRQTNSSSH